MLTVTAIFDIAMIATHDNQRIFQIGYRQQTRQETIKLLQIGHRPRQVLMMAERIGQPMLKEDKGVGLGNLP